MPSAPCCLFEPRLRFVNPRIGTSGVVRVHSLQMCSLSSALSKRTSMTEACLQTILDNSDNPYAQCFASSSLLTIVTEQAVRCAVLRLQPNSSSARLQRWYISADDNRDCAAPQNLTQQLCLQTAQRNAPRLLQGGSQARHSKLFHELPGQVLRLLSSLPCSLTCSDLVVLRVLDHIAEFIVYSPARGPRHQLITAS